MPKIMELRAENIKRLSLVHIHPDGKPVVVGGDNDVGKSSLLDSVMFTLSGKGSVTEMPIKRGEKRAGTMIRFDNGATVTRTYKGERSWLLVKLDGKAEPEQAPQRVLDGWFAAIGFDPLKFAAANDKEQATMLRELYGVDVSELDVRRVERFQARTVHNREVKRLEGVFATLSDHPDAPSEQVSIKALTMELQNCRSTNQRRSELMSSSENLVSEQERFRRRILEIGGDIEGLKEQISKLRDSRKELDENIKALQNGEKEQRETLAGIPPQDEEAVLTKIESAEGTNQKVRDNLLKQAAKADLTTAIKVSADDSRELDKIDRERADMLEAAKFPVPGLGFDGDYVTLDEVPFVQASSSQRIKVSVAIAIDANKKLSDDDTSIMIIREGPMLDDSNMKMVIKMAVDAGVQPLIERVGEDDHTTVIIEDGMVAT